MFSAPEYLVASTVGYFASEPELIRRTMGRLSDAGFEVLAATPYTINIAGSQKTYEKGLGISLYAEERPCMKSDSEDSTATFIEAKDAPMAGMIDTSSSPMADLIEGIAIEEPRYYFAPSMYAPLKAYWHLRVPGDISLGCNADKAHRSGITGKGIKIAMCDSGHYAHPFFAGRGYRVTPVTLGPGAALPLKDESGHGTGESANIFAVAPDIQLSPVKMNFANSIGAFNAAVALNPHIITCSWGSSKQFGPLSAADLALAAAIAAAVASGIIVVFSAGNGHWGFPGQHPDVISAGGVFMDKDESLRASNYSSGFPSNIYPGRKVPDLSGLVGMKPSAAYIMLPLEAGGQIDVGNAGGAHPAKDETLSNDGWAAFSGTSAAAPQLAGAAALVKDACAKLTPAQVRDILMKSAKDVTVGTSNSPSTPGVAGPGFDSATGAGLVDAHKATLIAKLRCISSPITVLPPIGVRPPISVNPPIGVNPPISVGPPIGIAPPRPIVAGPVPPQPIVGPIVNPVVNPGPALPRPAGESMHQPAGSSLSEEDVLALEDLIMKSGFDL